MPPAGGGLCLPSSPGLPSRWCWGGRRGFLGLPAPPPPRRSPFPPRGGPSRPLQQSPPPSLLASTCLLTSPRTGCLPLPTADRAPFSCLPAPWPCRPSAPAPSSGLPLTVSPPSPSGLPGPLSPSPPSPPHSRSVPITLSAGWGPRLGQILCLSVRLSRSLSRSGSVCLSLSLRLQFLVTRQCRAKLCLSSLPPHPLPPSFSPSERGGRLASLLLGPPSLHWEASPSPANQRLRYLINPLVLGGRGRGGSGGGRLTARLPWEGGGCGLCQARPRGTDWLQNQAGPPLTPPPTTGHNHPSCTCPLPQGQIAQHSLPAGATTSRTPGELPRAPHHALQPFTPAPTTDTPAILGHPVLQPRASPHSCHKETQPQMQPSPLALSQSRLGASPYTSAKWAGKPLSFLPFTQTGQPASRYFLSPYCVQALVSMPTKATSTPKAQGIPRTQKVSGNIRAHGSRARGLFPLLCDLRPVTWWF